MKSLSEFLTEQLIFELSSDTYLAAAKKAKELGDSRFQKFLTAYGEQVKKESDGSKEQENKYYQEDKKIFMQLNKIGKVKDSREWVVDGYTVTPILNQLKAAKGSQGLYLPRVFPSYMSFPWDKPSYNAKYFIASISNNDSFGFLAYEYPSDNVIFDMSPASKLKEPDEELKEVIVKILNAVSSRKSDNYEDYKVNKWRIR